MKRTSSPSASQSASCSLEDTHPVLFDARTEARTQSGFADDIDFCAEHRLQLKIDFGKVEQGQPTRLIEPDSNIDIRLGTGLASRDRAEQRTAGDAKRPLHQAVDVFVLPAS